jgi:hypothetical protein
MGIGYYIMIFGDLNISVLITHHFCLQVLQLKKVRAASYYSNRISSKYGVGVTGSSRIVSFTR